MKPVSRETCRRPVPHAFLRAAAALLPALGFLVCLAQTPQADMSPAERESLTQALGEAGNSQVDFVRALENHIARYPNSPKRADLERALVKSAMDLKDNDRIIRYGERVLERQPDDLQI